MTNPPNDKHHAKHEDGEDHDLASADVAHDEHANPILKDLPEGSFG